MSLQEITNLTLMTFFPHFERAKYLFSIRCYSVKSCSNHSWGLETLLLAAFHILVFDEVVHYALDQSPAVRSDVSSFVVLSDHCLKTFSQDKSWSNKITNINVIYEVDQFIGFWFNRFHHTSSDRACSNRFYIFCININGIFNICIFFPFHNVFFWIFPKNFSVNSHWAILISRFSNSAATWKVMWIFRQLIPVSPENKGHHYRNQHVQVSLYV